MGLAKRIGKNERIRGALCWLASLYIRLVWLTGRWRVENGHVPAEYWDRDEPFITVFWHGRLLMMSKCWRSGKTVHMLISQHRDGQLIARTIAHFGIRTTAGSTSRGGGSALRAMLRALKTGEYVGITPDGPRGPRMRASDGVITLAKLSGCPLIPVTYAATPRKLLRSWDRFLVPLPFGRGLITWGDPIFVPRDADEVQLEEYRQRIEEILNDQCARADRDLGLDPVAPA